MQKMRNQGQSRNHTSSHSSNYFVRGRIGKVSAITSIEEVYLRQLNRVTKAYHPKCPALINIKGVILQKDNALCQTKLN